MSAPTSEGRPRAARLYAVVAFALIFSTPLQSETVASLPGHSVALEELDAAGGAPLAEAAQNLYAIRVRTLYRLLADEVLAREAQRRNVTVDALLEAQAPPAEITEHDIEQLLAQRTGIDIEDSHTRAQARQYLALKHRSEARRQYIGRLFDEYEVRIALAPPPPPPTEEVRGAKEPALGPSTATVTIVVFTDYLCPYCRELDNTLEQLRARYPDEVRVIYRHFALHPGADRMAQAALCAADQGHFLDYHQKLFSTGSQPALETLAQTLGLDTERFNHCLEAATHAERVAADLQEGQRLQITGTPTLFVQGMRMRGAQPLTKLSAAVQAALQQSNQVSMR